MANGLENVRARPMDVPSSPVDWIIFTGDQPISLVTSFWVEDDEEKSITIDQDELVRCLDLSKRAHVPYFVFVLWANSTSSYVEISRGDLTGAQLVIGEGA